MPAAALEGKTIVITGGAGGIGLATARSVVEAGGRVALLDLDPAALERAKADLGSDRVWTAAGSVADEEFVTTAFLQAAEHYGALHGLVNNAGVTRPAMLTKMSYAQFMQVLEVHLGGSFLCTRALASHVIARQKAGDDAGASIVSISSDAGVQGTIGQVNYSAAKAGIIGLMMSSARELARYHIRANTVAFGVVETQMTETIRGDDFAEKYLAKIPLARWGRADEAAAMLTFLLSDAASYLTGQRISVNGGSQMNP